jgi:hypothetical protein
LHTGSYPNHKQLEALLSDLKLSVESRFVLFEASPVVFLGFVDFIGFIGTTIFNGMSPLQGRDP